MEDKTHVSFFKTSESSVSDVNPNRTDSGDRSDVNPNRTDSGDRSGTADINLNPNNTEAGDETSGPTVNVSSNPSRPTSGEFKQPVSTSLHVLRKNKMVSKSTLTKARNKLLHLLSTASGENRMEIRELTEKVEKAQDAVLASCAVLIEHYTEVDDQVQLERLNAEWSVIESDVKEAMDCVKQYLMTLCKTNTSILDSKSQRSGVSVLSLPLSQHRAVNSFQQPVERAIQQTASPLLVEQPAQRSIGADMWKQLKRVSIPIFTGDKRLYENWKATFVACVHQTPATQEFKLLQLRECLSGEPLKSIENLGHSGAAYVAALDRLDRKYGGKRRQVMYQFDEIRKFKPIRNGNAAELEQFADLLDITYINLNDSGLSSELDSQLLYSLLLEKMTQSMVARYKRWANENNQRESVAVLREFVISESDYETAAFESVNHSNEVSNTNKKAEKYDSSRRNTGRTHVTSDSKSNKQCRYCDDEHGIWACAKFKKLTPSERWVAAKQRSLCFRCLGRAHKGADCKRERSCGVNGCRRNHHNLLHDENYYQQCSTASLKKTDNSPGEKQLDAQSVQHKDTSQEITEGESLDSERKRTHTIIQSTAPTVTLRTIPVIVSNGTRSIKINALLDDASTATYINESVMGELGLHGKVEKMTVNVLNGQVETFDTMPVTFKLQSVDGKFTTNITAKTTKNVTGELEVIEWNKHVNRWKHLSGIHFPIIGRRTSVDLLIGLDYADLHYAVQDVRGEPGEPIARLTPLGWTCVGNISKGGSRPSINSSHYARTYFTNDRDILMEINNNLSRLWEIEPDLKCMPTPTFTSAEAEAVNVVRESLVFNDDRYQVGIPWKESTKPTLPNNYDMALYRLRNIETRLLKQTEIGKAYDDIINQYLEKQYIRKVPSDEQKPKYRWYLPHFPVIRLSRETTKTRIVFDAAARFKGVSLNDTINQGPKLQQDLFKVLVRFRKNPIAIVCDIAEMYLRIGIIPEDRPYQRFIWRGLDQNIQPEEYEFNRVVFGINASPFLAQYVTQEHARHFEEEFPLASRTILNSTYMDDSMDSVVDEETANSLYWQLSSLIERAGMYARKWLTNSTGLLSKIPETDRASQIDLKQDDLPQIKTLGVLWIAAEDNFSFCVNMPDKKYPITKRNILRKMASIFDPLQFLSPYIIRIKILIQELWIAGVNWDDPVPPNIVNEAREWMQELEDLEEIKVPRCLCHDISGGVSIHIFVDASERAHGAVAYLRNESGTEVIIRLIAAKSGVSPLTSVSIPRLELMGAILGLRLAIKVTDSLQISMNDVTFWTDSMNVIWWIRGHSREFKPFVANRIGKIHRHSSPVQWRYVKSESNPADLLTRGLTVKALAICTFWWEGPSFLKKTTEYWPKETIKKNLSKQEECKIKKYTYLNRGNSNNAIEWRLEPTRFSKWTRLLRVYSWVNRFINNCQQPKNSRYSDELCQEELMGSETELIKQAQRNGFENELAALHGGKQIPSNSKIAGLGPVLDNDGVMRVDGRLTNADFLSFDTQHPIILPRNNWTTMLIVRHCHERNKHATGTNHTYAELCARYWIIAGREVVRKCEQECKVCHRRKAKPTSQIMGPLPNIRIQPSLRAFYHTAVDYAGPFITKQGRGKTRNKRYLCLFTCMITRAVHLEMAYALDTNSFLNALNRMVNRRGTPRDITSDNGTNFVGANEELKRLIAEFDQQQIKKSMSTRGIKWNLNPPEGPHFGGVFESMIKSAKKAIYAILENAEISDEELLTAFTGAEALLNSRPLTYMSSHFRDEVPLTPNHFLFGQAGGQLAPEEVDGTPYNPHKRWRRVQTLINHVWQRWLKELLPALNRRPKWAKEERNMDIGDLVLVVDKNSPRGHWPLGRVLEIYPGTDGNVRVVKVQLGASTLTRPITKLCPLEYSRDGALDEGEDGLKEV